MELLRPSDTPGIAGIDMPNQFCRVLNEPAVLAGMAYPTSYTPWKQLHASGTRYVVCLTEATPSYDPAPLGLLHSVRLQDLYGGRWPDYPEKEEQLIREAALRIIDTLTQGEGVVVHCHGGTGRTGTVMGCVLRGLGFSLPEVIDYLDRLHKQRGRSGWPESKWQTEVVQRFQATVR